MFQRLLTPNNLLALCLSIHLFLITKIQPAFYNSVNHPDAVSNKNKNTYNKKDCDSAYDSKEQAIPKCLYLPCKVRLQPCPFNIVFFHIVNNDCNDVGNAEDKGRCLQGIDNGCYLNQ